MNNFGYAPYQYGYAQNQYSPMPMPNPYLQTPQSTSNFAIRCCEVDKEDDITPMNVPSDGTYALFATKDGSIIYKKYVNKYGLIDTIVYKCDVKADEEKHDTHNEILEKLEKIEETLASWSK